MNRSNAALAIQDEDSPAYHVRAFIDSVQQLSGDVDPAYHVGRALVEDRLLAELVKEGDDANPPLTPKQMAAVLNFLASIETVPGHEDHAAGGSANCGMNRVLRWLEAQVWEFRR